MISSISWIAFYENHLDWIHSMDVRWSIVKSLFRVVQRKALKSFTFSDGSHIPAGNLVSVPQRVVMQDQESYPEPKSFNPYRYIKAETDEDAPKTKYADVNWSYTFWGSPRKSWSVELYFQMLSEAIEYVANCRWPIYSPGRWYASYALKHIFVYLLTKYDFELENPEIPRYFVWTTAIVPRSDVYLSLRKRDDILWAWAEIPCAGIKRAELDMRTMEIKSAWIEHILFLHIAIKLALYYW